MSKLQSGDKYCYEAIYALIDALRTKAAERRAEGDPSAYKELVHLERARSNLFDAEVFSKDKIEKED